MDATRDYHTKWSSQKEKDKYMISLTCEVKNMAQVILSTKQKQTQREQTCSCQEQELIEGLNECLGLIDENHYI